MPGRLNGKTALVTGAGQGIGAAIARQMAAEGAAVIASDIRADQVAALAQEIGQEALRLDVTNPDDWAAAKAYIASRWEYLDVLVNNAGVELVKPLTDTSLADWRTVMAVNLDGAFLGAKTFITALGDAGNANPSGASIVNISSIAGNVGWPNQAAYNTSKAALRHLTKSLAIEFAEQQRNIRVNSIHPGCIRTPMLEDAVQGWRDGGRLAGMSEQAAWEAVARLSPLARIGTPEDIAYGVVYLTSDEAGFVTGLELVIDGGWIARG